MKYTQLLLPQQKKQGGISTTEKRGKYYLRDLDYKGSYSESMDYPITNPDGIEIYSGGFFGRPNTWRWSEDKFNWGLKNDFIVFQKSKNEWKVYIKQYQFVDNENKERKRFLPYRAMIEFSNTIGSMELNSLFRNEVFKYPKPIELIIFCSQLITQDNDTLLDFFGGSGTSAHAIMKQNQTGGKRKFILVEQSNYFINIISQRIKKVSYSFNWKKGSPQASNGIGVFFKYQKLEQYEDSLENIAFKNSEEVKQLPIYKGYIPKYFLEFETSESKTFLNTEEMKNPFDYKIKVFDNFDYIEQSVDLIETFNYLIGLYVHKYQIENDQKREYYFVYGKDREGKCILVIWRDVTKLDFTKDKAFIEKVLKNFSCDKIYINSQSAIEGYIQIETVFKNKMN